MEIPRHWRLKKQRYRLIGDVCESGHPAFPPDDVCKVCDPNEAQVSAIRQSLINQEEALKDIRRKITIYEANPDLYTSLDKIK